MDTVRGFVEHRNWDRNPSKIFFKSDLTSAVKVCSPLEIRSFFVKDEVYESAIIDVDKSPF